MNIGPITIICGDSERVCREMSSREFTAVLCDPPYGLSFMGRRWDHDVVSSSHWSAVASVCLPGAHLLAFGGTRTYHRQTCAIEDAGWTVRDCLMWVYGSGFPKSLDISKAIDKAAGVGREVLDSYDTRRVYDRHNSGSSGASRRQNQIPFNSRNVNITVPATPNAHTWQGYGTALKPALEPIVLAQLPREGTFVDNVLSHGCGALNIDGCRVDTRVDDYNHHGNSGIIDTTQVFGDFAQKNQSEPHPNGRWPSNLLIDDSSEVVGLFPESSSGAFSPVDRSNRSGFAGAMPKHSTYSAPKSSGSAARFFYCAKASRSEREAGLDDLTPATRSEITDRVEGSAGLNNAGAGVRARGEVRNVHPTVKPIALMRYLLRLLTQPERNHILDPFGGSGSTAVACALAGVRCTIIERDAQYVEIMRRRVQWAVDLRRRLGREPELDLSPYTRRAERADDDDRQESLF
jgi:DNA modification methylase